VTIRRTGAVGLLLLLASLAVGLVLAGPVGASEPGPAYPPGADAEDVVQAGDDTEADTEVGEPATAERPDDEADPADEGDGDDEVATDGQDTSDRAAPGGGGRGAGPILIVVGTAVLLGGAVVAIARRI
jgi:hypothetical protein